MRVVVGVLTVELYCNLCTDSFEQLLPDSRQNSCLLMQEEDLLDFYTSFKDLCMALHTAHTVPDLDVG